MRTRLYISLLLGMLAAASCVRTEEPAGFGADLGKIEIGADGGARKIRISSSGGWIAVTDNPWISVSPANGRGSADCLIQIDSALTGETRKGLVSFQSQGGYDNIEVAVEQEGYAYRISLENNTVTVPNYAVYGKRYFEVKVSANTEFDVEIPDDASWLSAERPEFEFNRGLRPREVTLRFDWKISSQPERLARVRFVPRSAEVSNPDMLTVIQMAAPEIEAETRRGDSVAVLGLARSLGAWQEWDESVPMDQWEGVVLWEEGMDGYTEEKAGRIRSADIYMFGTREGLPYEVQYLTAAEELSFRGNVNSFLYSLNPGEYITKLTGLKRLTMMGYGLTEIGGDFIAMQGLEYLDISANNFETFPSVLRKENFPNLKHLVMNANQRVLVYDLSNASLSDLGGFYAATSPDGEFPRWLLEWDTLESLVLGVNYLQGHLPALDDDESWTSFYTEADVARVDSLPSGSFRRLKPDGSPEGIVGLPKVWPRMKRFTINYNRMTGTLPDWLLYHPNLDWWVPFTFVFNQEGKDETGRNAGFDNEPPTTMEYYYNFYPKKQNPYGDEDAVEDKQKK